MDKKKEMERIERNFASNKDYALTQMLIICERLKRDEMEYLTAKKELSQIKDEKKDQQKA